MNIKGFKVLSTVALSALLLAACSEDKEKTVKNTPEDDAPGKETEEAATNEAKFPLATTNSETAIEGGHLNFALVSTAPFEGILNFAFYQGGPDENVLQFFDEALLQVDENYIYNNEGAATYEMSNENKTVTVTIKDNVKWHDGKPVTAADLEYAYLVIGSPEYAGVRYDSQMQLLEGMEDYHAGKADSISGIKVDGNTISFTYTQANPSLLSGGLWTYPLHKEYLKDVAIKDLESSDKIRKNPIGFGPFKVKSIVQGEAVEYEAFKDYWKGTPKLDSLTLKVVNPDVVGKSLENGEIDIAEITSDQYDPISQLENIELVGMTDFYYQYIGFKFGHYDADKKETVMDNPKFQSKELRQAMAYAIDTSSVADELYKGLRFSANSVIPTVFDYHNEEVGYKQDVEKAKELLDKAGYVDKDNDGFREDPKGEKFTISFLARDDDSTSEPLANYYIQQWADVGLNVSLKDGRLGEFNSFYDAIQTDDPEVEIYQAAWGTGSDPDPSGIWQSDADFNYTRWVNEKSDELLAKGISEEAFDEKYRKDVYDEWQKLIYEEVPLIPTFYRYSIVATNKRVKDYNVKEELWSEVSVTSEDAIK